MRTALVASKKKAKQCLQYKIYFILWRDKAEVCVCWLWVYYSFKLSVPRALKLPLASLKDAEWPLYVQPSIGKKEKATKRVRPPSGKQTFEINPCQLEINYNWSELCHTVPLKAGAVSSLKQKYPTSSK